ncbi:MAG TPA: hypothetical protein VNQ56_13625 [Pseudolabrys sp.]|nr:hypothetical protein [Pseudolabrys sp.]
MRSLFAAFSLLVFCTGAPATELAADLAAAPAAQPDRRLFIVANNPDGYGIDRCLANGERCGAAIATSFCRARAFSAARSFHRVDRDEITGAIPVSGPTGPCSGGLCQDFVAIECAR